MKINAAHLQHPSTSGTKIDFIIFDAKPNSVNESNNQRLLNDLTIKAKANGLKVDQAALAYIHNNQQQYWGSKNLVDFLSKNGVPKWTHDIDA